MTAGMSSSKPAVLAIAIGSPATLLMMTTPIAPAALAFATFWLKVHVAAVNDCKFAGGAGIDAGATVRMGVEEIERRLQVTGRSHPLLRRWLFRRPLDT